jgi:hypothetical protein
MLRTSRLRELSGFVPLFVDQPLAFEPGSEIPRGDLAGGVEVAAIFGKFLDVIPDHTGMTPNDDDISMIEVVV